MEILLWFLLLSRTFFFVTARRMSIGWLNLGILNPSSIPTSKPLYRNIRLHLSTDLMQDTPYKKQSKFNICPHLPFLTKSQKEICSSDENLVHVLMTGAQEGLSECQHQFKGQQWDCTIHNGTSIFFNQLDKNTKETAFVYSIASAGIVYHVMKGCTKGVLKSCSCNAVDSSQSSENDFKWRGCSDNFKYGSSFARKFLESKSQKKNAETLIHWWNSGAGRRAIRKSFKRKCRCHGYSATCTARTCWLTVENFRDVGNWLKSKFESASRVRVIKKAHGLRLKRANKKRTKVPKTDLVYTEKTPNFCRSNGNQQMSDMTGRECSTELGDPNNCRKLCCGRGYITLQETVQVDCKCKFVWCCSVRCSKCWNRRVRHVCK